MSTNLIILIDLLDKVFIQLPKSKKGGKPLKYGHFIFIVFFIVVLYKRIFRFKTMEKYAKVIVTSLRKLCDFRKITP